MRSFSSFRSEYLVLIFVFVLFNVNYFIQNQQSELVVVYYHLCNLFYVSTLLYYRKKDNFKFSFLCLFYFIAFHQYGSDPYSEEFSSFMSGPYKFIVFLLFFSSLEVISLRWLPFYLLLLLTTIHQIMFGDRFRVEYLFNDLVFYIAVLPVLMSSRDGIKSIVDFNKVAYMLYIFSLTLPISSTLVYVLDLFTVLHGSYYFFYGHAISFVFLYSVIYFISIDKEKNILKLLLCVINLLIVFQASQTAYYIIFILAIVAYCVFNGKAVKVLYAPFVFFIIYLTNLSVPEDSWLYLKTGQLTSLFLLDVASIVESSNSFAIRIYELTNIIDESNFFELFFGSGLGSVYYDNLHLFHSSMIHEASFPKKEILSGEFHLVHETLIRLFFHVGIFGFLIFYAVFYKSLKGGGQFINVFIFIYFSFLWLSSLQAVFFLTIIMTIIKMRNIGEH